MKNPEKAYRLDISKIRGKSLYGFFLQAYPRETMTMVAALFFASILEGFGIVSLVPAIELATQYEKEEMSPIAYWVAIGFEWIGVEMTIANVLTLTVLLIAAKAFFMWISFRQVGYTVANVSTELRLALIQELMSVQWKYFIKQPVGKITNALGWEAHKTSVSYEHIAILLAGCINVVLYTSIALLASWKVVIVAFLLGGIFILSMKGLVRLSRSAGVAQAGLMKSLSSRLADLVNGVKPLIAMGKEERVLPLLQNETRELNTALRMQVLARSVPEVVREPFIVLVLAVLLFVFVEAQDAPISSFLLLALLFHRLAMRLTMLQSSYQAIATGEGAFRSLRQTFEDLFDHRIEGSGKGIQIKLDSKIELEDVTFAYDGNKVLDDVSLIISPGEFVTIEGPSGAGKTTLIDLLLGLHHPSTGKVLIDGVSMTDVDRASFRMLVGYVPQEMYLFHDAIFRNVTLGEPSLTYTDCEKALRDAGAWDFVKSMPDGMDTVVGERGTRLSGGQRQRIALARALTNSPKLLILDEVTSGLDPVSEELVCSTLASLKGKVTIIAVSHQPALASIADVVYHLRNGKVASVDKSTI